jgi:hypothetical protein
VNQRERVLAIGLGTVVGGWLLFSTVKSRIIEPLRARDGQIMALRGQIEAKKTELAAAQKGAMELSGWRRASLPADESVAQTLYLDYIRRLLSEAGIDRPTIRPGRSINRADVYSRLPVTVDARADLAKLTAFLREFEAAPLLHQIRRLRIQPVLKDDKIEAYDLSMSLEAVAMPDSFSKDTLPTAELVGDALANRPSRGDQEFKIFVEKNPFQPTAVTSSLMRNAADKPASSQVDERSEYYVRAILFVEGEGVAWFVKQGSDDKKSMKKGDKLEVGGFSGTVLAIESDSVQLQVNELIGSVRLGKTLADWKKTGVAPSPPSPPPSEPASENSATPTPPPEPSPAAADTAVPSSNP